MSDGNYAWDELERVMVIVRDAARLEERRKELFASLRAVQPAIRRVEAYQQGWRQIAMKLLVLATGDEAIAFGEVPPLELLELRSDGELARYVPALEQFWRDLTRTHEERRTRASGPPVPSQPSLSGHDLSALHAVRSLRMSTRSDLTPYERRVFDRLYEVIAAWGVG